MKKFIVYMHTCLLTGKSYVGWTKYTMMQRWRVHCRYSRGRKPQHHFNRAITKYGTECWLHSVLEEFDTRKEAKAGEMKWIKELQTYGKNGYNETRGGDGAVGHKLSPEACKALSEQKREFFKDPANRKKISDSVKARLQDPILKKQISDALKATYATPEARKHVSEGLLKKHQDDPSYREKLRKAQRGNSNAYGHKLSEESITQMIETKRKNHQCEVCGEFGHYKKSCSSV